MNKSIHILLLFFAGLTLNVQSQTDSKVPPNLKGKMLFELEDWVNNSTRFKLFLSVYADSMKIEFPENEASLSSVLAASANKHKLNVYEDKRGFHYLGNNIINKKLPDDLFGSINETPPIVKQSSEYLKTLSARPNKIVIIGNRKAGIGKKVISIKGKIVDSKTGSPVIGATIWVNETKTGASTDLDGNYKLILPKGAYTLSVRSLEKVPVELTIKVFSDDEVNISMARKSVELKEMVVSSEAKANVERPEMGMEKLSLSQIKKIPQMMGEPDIVKSALLLPGVQSVAEGTGQLNVRGAPADQNIFYLDGIPVYNTTHLMGFFSAFTPNAIEDLTIYKSSLPSRYGGRLSSVFDIGTNQGSKNKFGLRGGISPITTDVQIEGPIDSNKISYMVAARSTYSSWILDRIDVPQINSSSAAFKDMILRLDYDVNDKSSITTTLYYSTDLVKLNGLTSYAYSNTGASLAWTRYLKQKHSLVLSTAMGAYNFDEENVQFSSIQYLSNNSINHTEARAELILRPTWQHSIHIGISSVLYQLDLGEIKAFGAESLIKPIDMGQDKGLESALFIEEQWIVGSRLTINTGVRLNLYQYLGPNQSYVYSDPIDRKESEVIDTLNFEKNKVIFSSIDPDIRLSLKYSVTELLSIKASANQTHQYINILSNNVTITPSSRWKLSDSNIKPMEGWHYSVGLFKNVDRKFEISIEGYYKHVNHLLDYREGAELIFSPRPETEVLQGDLSAYGVEFMFRKVMGDLTGWFNYTYARSFVKVEKINQGLAYPANFDKPHSVNLSFSYQYSTRISLSSNIIYASGRPVTYPSSVFYQSNFPLTYYSARNEYRIPYYFRCDVGINIEGNLKAKKKFHGSWHFGVYNLFGRNNPFTVYAVPENGKINGYQLSIFGSPIPSLSYRLKLGNYAR